MLNKEEVKRYYKHLYHIELEGLFIANYNPTNGMLVIDTDPLYDSYKNQMKFNSKKHIRYDRFICWLRRQKLKNIMNNG